MERMSYGSGLLICMLPVNDVLMVATFPTGHGGGKTEEARCEELSQKLEVPVSTAQFCQSHTPMRALAEAYHTVLVVGGQGEACRIVAETYGFKDIVTPGDIAAWRPDVTPFRTLTEKKRNLRNLVTFRRSSSMPSWSLPIAATGLWTRRFCLKFSGLLAVSSGLSTRRTNRLCLSFPRIPMFSGQLRITFLVSAWVRSVCASRICTKTPQATSCKISCNSANRSQAPTSTRLVFFKNGGEIWAEERMHLRISQCT